jgi:uncharacterized protein YgbK (DUF1537 family)
MSDRLRLMDVLNRLPPVPDLNLLPDIRANLLASGRKIIVLDDDPTGTQTVADVPVLTTWRPEMLIQELNDPQPLAYLLTNSRSLPTAEAKRLAHEIASALREALKTANRPIELISRSDSTLRGHFPQEVYALADGMDWDDASFVVAPAFFEGGRYTYENVHYVAEGDWLIPAAETEYARDAYFGYRSSDLSAWICEKHAAAGLASPADRIQTVSLPQLRTGDVDAVAEQLRCLPSRGFCVINAMDYRDLEVFAAALAKRTQAGQRLVARSAASYVRVRAGLERRDLLRGAALVSSTLGRGGLVVAGSHIQKSTRQIEQALQHPQVRGIELNVRNVLDDNTRPAEIERAAQEVNTWLSADAVALLYTSREFISSASNTHTLQIGERIASALVEVVQRLAAPPRWIVAKGGITSSDVATKALGVQRAVVLGQLMPGVPVWRTSAESRFHGLTYVVFPGNVGADTAIAEAITLLQQAVSENNPHC